MKPSIWMGPPKMPTRYLKAEDLRTDPNAFRPTVTLTSITNSALTGKMDIILAPSYVRLLNLGTLAKCSVGLSLSASHSTSTMSLVMRASTALSMASKGRITMIIQITVPLPSTSSIGLEITKIVALLPRTAIRHGNRRHSWKLFNREHSSNIL